MTEDEARTKWCPFSMTGAYTDRGPMGAVAVNRDPRLEVEQSCLCRASDCMAWRWTFANQSAYEGGYCGLAGRPLPQA